MDCLLKCGRVMVVRGWGLPESTVERVDSRRCGKERVWGQRRQFCYKGQCLISLCNQRVQISRRLISDLTEICGSSSSVSFGLERAFQQCVISCFVCTEVRHPSSITIKCSVDFLDTRGSETFGRSRPTVPESQRS